MAAEDARNWIVTPEPYDDGQGGIAHDDALSDDELAAALLELGPILKRQGGTVVINTSRTKVGEPDLYVTSGLIVSHKMHLPLAKKREVEAVEESEPDEPQDEVPEPIDMGRTEPLPDPEPVR